MRLKEEQITGLAERVLRGLTAAHLITSKASEAELVAAIAEPMHRFSEAARAVDEGVKKVMTQYGRQMQVGQVDTQKMYGMIRKQVAKDLKFDLEPDEQVSVLAHKIHDTLYQDDLVDYLEEERALRQIKETLRETLKADDILGEKVRHKILSLKRSVPEGSAEWQILYEKYLEEELNKRGF